ncbi:cyanobactin maturation protease PatG family protein [Kitasatospora sp. NPDC004240]
MDPSTDHEFPVRPEPPADDRPPAEPDRLGADLAPAAAAGTATIAAAGCGCDTAAGCGCDCEHGGGAEPTTNYVYVLGQIDVRYPSLAIEKEVAQAVARYESSDLTDRQALRAVISQPENRYLARQLCYVLCVQGMETYILRPRDPVEFDRLVEAVRPEPKATDLDVVIGHRGPLAPPSLCNGLTIPVVTFEQVYSFSSDELVAALHRPKKMDRGQFEDSSNELLFRVMQLADNAGDTDEHRAINYLAVRYPKIYQKTVEAFAANCSLSGVTFHESRLSGARRIIDVVFCYTDRRTDVCEKYFVRVDVTEAFPFLVNKLSPYYNR